MPTSPRTQPSGPSIRVGAASSARARIAHRRPGRVLATLVLATGVTIGVSGCQQATTASEGSPTIAESDLARIASGNKSPSSSSSATSGESGSEQQFVVPEAAKAHTKDGAIAFVKFYWNMLGQLDSHPQAGVIPRFSSLECASCVKQEEKAKEFASSGSHVESVGRRLTNFRVKPESINDSVIATFNQSDPSRVRIDKDGSRHPLPRIDWFVAARADWVNGEWKLGMSGADER